MTKGRQETFQEFRWTEFKELRSVGPDGRCGHKCQDWILPARERLEECKRVAEGLPQCHAGKELMPASTDWCQRNVPEIVERLLKD